MVIDEGRTRAKRATISCCHYATTTMESLIGLEPTISSFADCRLTNLATSSTLRMKGSNLRKQLQRLPSYH
jgi:hypothetical protein